MARSSARSEILTDHDEIQQWAEERNAKPACVRGTGDSGDIGMIRLEFPDYSGDEPSLQQINWDEWFEKFDENNLALLVQERTAAGEQSNFNKLVSRETAENNSIRGKKRAGRNGGGEKNSERGKSFADQQGDQKNDEIVSGSEVEIFEEDEQGQAEGARRVSAGQTRSSRNRRSSSGTSQGNRNRSRQSGSAKSKSQARGGSSRSGKSGRSSGRKEAGSRSSGRSSGGRTAGRVSGTAKKSSGRSSSRSGRSDTRRRAA